MGGGRFQVSTVRVVPRCHLHCIPFSTVGTSKALAISQERCLQSSVLGEVTRASSSCSPCLTSHPVSGNVYSNHMDAESVAEVQDSMKRARDEIRQHYGILSPDEVADSLVCCDGT